MSVPVSADTAAIRDLTSYLDGLLQHTNAVVYVRDAVDSRYLLVNPAFEALLGLPAEQVVGRTGHDLFPADVADEHLSHDLAVLASGRGRTTREIAPHRDGTVHAYVTQKFPLYDVGGRAYAVAGISTDVTELERARTSLTESEDRYGALVELSPVAIAVHVGGVFRYANAATVDLLGASDPSELVGRPVLDVIPPAEREMAGRRLASMLGRAKGPADPWHVVRLDGERRIVEMTAAAVRWEGEPAVQLEVRDVTEETRSRELLALAHRQASESAARWGLLHAVATAANDALTIEEAAGDVLAATCEHFGFAAAVLRPVGHGGPLPALPALTAPIRHVADGPLAAEVRAALDAGLEVTGLKVTGLHRADVVTISVDDEVAAACEFFDAADPTSSPGRHETLELVVNELARVLERQQAVAEKAANEARFRTMFVSSPVSMALSDDTGRFVSVNPAFCELLGREEEQMLGRSSDDFTHPEDLAGNARISQTLQRADGQVHRVEKRYRHSSGRVVWGLLSVTRVTFPDGRQYTLAQVEDVTDRRKAEDDLHRQARHDALTGLANRSALSTRLGALAWSGEALAVLFVDLDGFKLVNDSRGHSAGDVVLREVARRIADAVRPDDLVARFGGDEFVVVCRGVDTREAALEIARRVEEVIAAPVVWRAGTLEVTASVGISLTGGTAGPRVLDAEELLRRADTAMYLAKRRGKDRADLYDEELHADSQSRSRTAEALREALSDDGLQVHFQPIVDLRSGEVVSAEALVKLLDHGSQVRTAELVEVAEETGLIMPLGAFVLRRACAEIARLRRETGRSVSVSVNLSARQASQPDLASSVLRTLEEVGLEPEGLALELTESALLEFNEATLTQLTILRESGVGVGIDDFGTGYSSLTYLRRFPVSFLKVDRAFVLGLPESERDAVIVRAVVGLARDLGLGCVVEGVETSAQLAAVEAMGAPHAQGFLFAQPLPVEELRALLGEGTRFGADPGRSRPGS